MSDRTRAGLSFFQTRIHTDLRRFELERGRESSVGAQSACSNRRASGALYFERARMSENMAQGQDSEWQDAREVIIFLDTDLHRFTQI